ncbi:hypothetical protein HWV62_1903 [Athelia sp. TMB]|nr:hypothetical protein HWV62_1903 [Athelia sp. TMB]
MHLPVLIERERYLIIEDQKDLLYTRALIKEVLRYAPQPCWVYHTGSTKKIPMADTEFPKEPRSFQTYGPSYTTATSILILPPSTPTDSSPRLGPNPK